MKLLIFSLFFIFTGIVSAQTPKFIDLNTNKNSYVVGDRAVLMASIRTTPVNSDEEIFLKSTLAGANIKILMLGLTEGVHVTPALAAGAYLWEVKAYIQNKDAALNLITGIAECDAQDIKLNRLYAAETDTVKRAKLMDAITENMELKAKFIEQLDAGRVLVETKQQTVSVTPVKRNISMVNPITINVDHTDQIYFVGQSAYVTANIDLEAVESDEELSFESVGSFDNQFMSKMDPTFGYFGFSVQQSLLTLGQHAVKIDLYSRNHRNATSLKSAQANANFRKYEMEGLRDSATSSAMAAYYQKEIDDIVLIQAALTEMYSNSRSFVASATATINVQTATITYLAAANNSNCTIKGASLSCWGANDSYQMGLGNTTNQVIPSVNFTLGHGVSQVAMYDKTVCAIKFGQLYCWGGNVYGQLGNGTITSVAYPELIPFTNPVTKVATGITHSCAVSGGKLFCWGDNTYGQYGYGSTGNSWVPMLISTAENITDVAIGASATCVITVSGKLLCSGFNGNGQLGDGTIVNKTTFVQIIAAGVTAVSMNNNTGCAIVAGGAKCWGHGGNGRVGNGTTTANITSPVTPTGLTAGVTSISVGYTHTCAVVSGAARCWGTNTNGLLGAGTANATVWTAPQTMSTFASGVERIVTGTNTTCLIKSGVLSCWGLNSVGQLGNGTTTNNATAVNPTVQIYN
jgi:Alpha-tubulin suppressor and related RCC1 domain-containing proteins